MKIVELLIDELDEFSGVDAVALVESPAIEADFYAFNEVDKEDVIAYNLIKLAVEELEEDKKKEFVRVDLPVGETTILQAEGEERGLRVSNNEDKSYDVAYWWRDDSKAMSIEVELDGKPVGYAENIHLKFHPELDYKKDEFESYTDYPESATNAAKRALEWRDSHPDNDCGTRVGWTRANQLADRRPISEDTIARMASFARHLQHEDVPYSEGCGGLMVDAWGGRAGIEWASNKLDRIRNESSKFSFAIEEDQQMVVGPLMIPDKLILRTDQNNDPYYIFFSKDTVQKIAEKLMRNKFLDNLNLEHNPEQPVKGHMVSTWIVEDKAADKQGIYGMDLPQGTWMGQYKIEDSKTWQMVKDGLIKGFSVEGFFQDKFIQASKNI